MFGAVLFMQLKGSKQTEEKAPETRPMGRLLLFLVIGIAAIVIGGQITVDGATSLARIHLDFLYQCAACGKNGYNGLSG